MRFLIKLAFWIGVVIYYLPADDSNSRAPTVKPKYERAGEATGVGTSARIDRCINDVVGCARQHLPANTLKPSDLEPVWRGIKQTMLR